MKNPYRLNPLPRITRSNGFTMLEIMIATVVMAMMIVSLLGFVHITSATWQRTDQQINLAAEAMAVLDSLRYYVANAATMTPHFDSLIPQTTGTPSFVIQVATGSIEANNELTGTITILLRRPAGQPTILVATYTSWSPPGPGKITFVPGTPTAGNQISGRQFVGTLTEHLASLSVTRRTLFGADVYLRLESPRLGEIHDTNNATPAFEIYTSLFGPNLATESRIWLTGAKAKDSKGNAYGKVGK